MSNELASRIDASMENAAEAERAERVRLVDETRAAIPPEVAAAMRATGMKASEIRSVKAEKRGVLVVPTSGPNLLIVDPACPDAEGKSGLMLETPMRGRSALPVYAAQPNRRERKQMRRQAEAEAKKTVLGAAGQLLETEIFDAVEMTEAEAADTTLRTYLVEIAKTRAEIERIETTQVDEIYGLPTPNAVMEVQQLRAAEASLTKLAKGRRAYVHRDDPEPRPDEWRFRLNRAMILWARGILDGNDEAWRAGCELHPQVTFCPKNLAQSEYDGAVAFLEQWGEELPPIPGAETEPAQS